MDTIKQEKESIVSVKELVGTLLNELEKRNLLKKRDYSFKETENILKNYNYLDTSITLLKKKLKKLESEKKKLEAVLIKSSKIALREKEKTYYYTDETLESDINILKQRIIKVETEKNHIDACLKELSTDEYYDIITMLYFECKTPQEIQDFYDISQSTFYEHKNKLIRALIILLKI